MKQSQRPMPPVKVGDGDEAFETTENLPFRTSLTVIARSLMGISLALHRIADTLETNAEAAYLDSQGP